MRAVWAPSGFIFQGFWSHLEVKDRFLGSVLVGRRFGSVLEASWAGFWRVLEASQGGFSKYFRIFFGYWLRNRFLYAFIMIFDGCFDALAKEKWAFRMEGVAKSNFRVVCLRRRIQIDFGRILGLAWRQFRAPSGAKKRIRKEML